MTRYHWFVLVVAALGWLFDCLDQQLFILARQQAMKDLLPVGDPAKSKALVDAYAGYVTSIFLIGWACGGLIFGVLGDRIGRAKTMMITILLYSLFTGLSAIRVTFWDFAIYHNTCFRRYGRAAAVRRLDDVRHFYRRVVGPAAGARNQGPALAGMTLVRAPSLGTCKEAALGRPGVSRCSVGTSCKVARPGRASRCSRVRGAAP